MTLLDEDAMYVGRDNPALPVEITGGKGGLLFGPNGEEYIDFLMGWCVGNIGWGNDGVKKALAEFDGPDYVLPSMLYKPWVELAKILADITPGKLQKSFRATGGTEAVEIALQAAMSHTKRQKFVSIEGSYHGHSIGAMSVGGSYFRNDYKNLLDGCYKISPPLNESAAREIEKLLETKEVAAYISEPISCNLGVEIPDSTFFEIVQAACKRTGTVFIIDEVATGFGRTGKMFAAEHYNLEPDIMTFAKGLSGGYGAIGATIMTDEIAKSFAYDFSFYSTFGWHPRNVVAALANVRYLVKNQQSLLHNVADLNTHFVDRLKQIKFQYPATIRAKGLAIAVRFPEEGYARQIVDRCREKKLLFDTIDSYTFTFFPALNIDKQTADRGLAIFESCV